MSFGFSVGDFVAVGGLIVKIVDSLRGTQSEYQELIRELDSLKRALAQVDKLKGRGDQAIAIEQIKCVALSCRYPLEEFLAKIQKYDKSLGLGKSVGKIKDAGRKVQYAFGKKDEANTLRSKLGIHIGTINMLLAWRGLEKLHLDSEQRDKNQEELRDMIEGWSRGLREVRGNVEAQALGVRENSSIIRKLFWMVSGEIAAPLKSLSQTVANVCVSTQKIYIILLELRASLPGMDTRFTFFQDPVRVEDALGRVFPFSSECSIEALNAEIKSRFRKGPGKTEVMAGGFEIFNAKNTDQVLTTSGHNVLLPGMSINMAIVVEKEFVEGDQCPMPHCPSKTFVKAIGGGRTCSECGVWIDGASKKRKRDFEVEKISKHVKLLANRNRNKAVHPDLQEAPALSGDEEIAKTEQSESDETSISAFKRIRFDTGLQALTTEELDILIKSKRNQMPYSDVQLREVIQRLKLYGAAEAVLNGLNSVPEHSRPFLRPFNKCDAPDYDQVIKRPMDLGAINKKLKNLHYNCKGEIVDDLNLIWANCLRYFRLPTHPFRQDALWMREEAGKLIPLMPDIVIKPMSIEEAARAKVPDCAKKPFPRTASQSSENNNTKFSPGDRHGGLIEPLSPSRSKTPRSVSPTRPTSVASKFLSPPNSRSSSGYDSDDDLISRSPPLVPQKVNRGFELNRKDKKRHRKAQASQGDAVLIGYLGGLNHPNLVIKAGEMFLLGPSGSANRRGFEYTNR